MALLSTAVKQERWDVAALCLILGLMRASLEVPEDALPGLLEVLGGDDAPTG